MSTPTRLSDKSIAVLTLIAQGHSYAQIVDSQPDLTYLDIFAAAGEALWLHESRPDPKERLQQIKAKHARAYEPWTAEDDAALAAMSRRLCQVSEMAERFGRQPSAIRSRLAKLGLTNERMNVEP